MKVPLTVASGGRWADAFARRADMPTAKGYCLGYSLCISCEETNLSTEYEAPSRCTEQHGD